ncbi:MAG: AraC family transcriptional regulator [Burkholderiaceae bacterium]|nr:AraC family transcriptional regulator [Burkholderiaceae bacterium]
MPIATLPELRERSRAPKDQIYWFGAAGFIFTSHWVVTSKSRRPAAVLLLSATYQPLTVTLGKTQLVHDVIAVAPRVQRGLDARDAGLVSVHLFPPHPLYQRFARLPRPGALVLSRAPVAHLDATLRAAFEGRLTLDQARVLFDELVSALEKQLPPAPAPHAREESLHARLLREPDCSLAELARQLGLSYSGASRHFSRTVGLSFRSYRLWLKYYLASEYSLRGANWTEAASAAGFTDSSHLVHAWRASFGMTPSHTNDPQRVRAHYEATLVKTL